MTQTAQNNSVSKCSWNTCPISVTSAVLAILGLAVILILVFSAKSNKGNLLSAAPDNSRIWQGMAICLMILCVAGCLTAASKGR